PYPFRRGLTLLELKATLHHKERWITKCGASRRLDFCAACTVGAGSPGVFVPAYVVARHHTASGTTTTGRTEPPQARCGPPGGHPTVLRGAPLHVTVCRPSRRYV